MATRELLLPRRSSPGWRRTASTSPSSTAWLQMCGSPVSGSMKKRSRTDRILARSAAGGSGWSAKCRPSLPPQPSHYGVPWAAVNFHLRRIAASRSGPRPGSPAHPPEAHSGSCRGPGQHGHAGAGSASRDGQDRPGGHREGRLPLDRCRRTLAAGGRGDQPKRRALDHLRPGGERGASAGDLRRDLSCRRLPFGRPRRELGAEQPGATADAVGRRAERPGGGRPPVCLVRRRRAAHQERRPALAPQRPWPERPRVEHGRRRPDRAGGALRPGHQRQAVRVRERRRPVVAVDAPGGGRKRRRL